MSDDNSGALGAALNAKEETNADASAADAGALMEGPEVKFNARIPENLRDEFAKVCNREGRSMSATIRLFMRRSVQDGETGL